MLTVRSLCLGAGGSVGSELCRQLLSCKPKRIVLYEVSEVALYTIDKELRDLAMQAPGSRFAPCWGLLPTRVCHVW